MSVKLARYVFRRIRGRIVPVRRSIDVASPEVSKLVDSIKGIGTKNPIGPRAKFLGKGVDFKVYSAGDEVVKLPLKKGYREKLSQYVGKKYPFLKNPVERAASGARVLPDYGIQTVEAKRLRISKKQTAILQERIPTDRNDWVQREAMALSKSSGLDLDPNMTNLTKAGLRDAALGKMPTKAVITSGVTKNKWGISSAGRTNPESANWILESMQLDSSRSVTDVITEGLAVESASRKALRALGKAKKSGARLKIVKGSSNEFRFVSAAERIAEAKQRGISFIKKNGKIVPVRKK